MPHPASLPAHGHIPEPSLLFHTERESDQHVHPLQGLMNFGPYSRSLERPLPDPIRVAFIVPNEGAAKMKRIWDGFFRELKPIYQRDYLPVFPGFEPAFKVRLVPAKDCHIRLDIPEDLVSKNQPHKILADAFTKAITDISSKGEEFDVLIIYLPGSWASGFEGGPGEDFDLHDFIKGLTATFRIPVQLIKEKTADYQCQASIIWNLSLALYVKAGGLPWRLANSQPGTAFIGLSYALKPGDVDNRFVSCCSQIFDDSGTGLRFLTYGTEAAHVERRNPFLSRTEMARLMDRSLSLYQNDRMGQIPARIVVHKTTRFTDDEVAGCRDALSRVGEVELVQIQENTPWRGVQYIQNVGLGKLGGYPCERGTFLPISKREVLLWTSGDSPESASLGKSHYYKEGNSIPAPLLIRRFAGHGDWQQVCSEILNLTKMNWNNDGLYDHMPVTLSYSSVLARIIKRMPKLASGTYDFRFFM
jgi:argonaute-like protein implicated in RNA metabolism and viral defense